LKLIPILIDFPQMVSMDHQNAEMYFDRDVNCIKRFFERRFHFVSSEPGPFFKDAKKLVGSGGATRIDAALEASGFTKKMLKDLEAAIREQAASKDEGGENAGSSEEEEGEGEEEYEEEDVERDTEVVIIRDKGEVAGQADTVVSGARSASPEAEISPRDDTASRMEKLGIDDKANPSPS
jgi:RIO kinase 2